MRGVKGFSYRMPHYSIPQRYTDTGTGGKGKQVVDRAQKSAQQILSEAQIKAIESISTQQTMDASSTTDKLFREWDESVRN